MRRPFISKRNRPSKRAAIEHKKRLKKRKAKFGGLAAFVYDTPHPSKKRRGARLGPL